MTDYTTNYEIPTHYPKEWLSLSMNEKNKNVIDLIETQLQKSGNILKSASNSTNTMIDEVVNLFPYLRNKKFFAREETLFQAKNYNYIFNLGKKTAEVPNTRVDAIEQFGVCDKRKVTIRNDTIEIESTCSEKVTSEESSDDSTVKAVHALENNLVANSSGVKMYRERCFEDYSHSRSSKPKEGSVSYKSFPNRKESASFKERMEDVRKRNYNNYSDYTPRGKKLTWKPSNVKPRLTRTSPFRKTSQNAPSQIPRRVTISQQKKEVKLSPRINKFERCSRETNMKQLQEADYLETSANTQSLINEEENEKELFPPIKGRTQPPFQHSPLHNSKFSERGDDIISPNQLIKSCEVNYNMSSNSKKVLNRELNDIINPKTPTHRNTYFELCSNRRMDSPNISNSDCNFSCKVLKDQGNDDDNSDKVPNNKELTGKKQDKPLLSFSRKQNSMCEKNGNLTGQNVKLPQILVKTKSCAYDKEKGVSFFKQKAHVNNKKYPRSSSGERYSAVRGNNNLFPRSLNRLLPKNSNYEDSRNSFLSGSTELDFSVCHNKTSEEENRPSFDEHSKTVITESTEQCGLKHCELKISSVREKFSTGNYIQTPHIPTSLSTESLTLKPSGRLCPLPKSRFLIANILKDLPFEKEKMKLIDETQLSEHKIPTLPCINLK